MENATQSMRPEDLTMSENENLCDVCAALCCRYIALPIDNPETLRDYDDIRWYLAHENIVVFTEDDQWFVGILNKCKHLQPDNRCGIYFTRPRICRKYSTDNCDYHGGEYNFDKFFNSAEQLWQYAKKTVAAERSANRAKAKSRRKVRRRPKLNLTPGLLLAGRNGTPTSPPGNASKSRGLSLPLLRS